MRYEATFRRSSKRATQLARQGGRTASGLRESAAGAKRVRQEFIAATWRVGGTQLRALLRDRRYAALPPPRTGQHFKAAVVHVGAFNLSLILRHLVGAGTPRELSNRSGQLVLSLLLLLWYGTVSNHVTAAVSPHRLLSTSQNRVPGCAARCAENQLLPPRPARAVSEAPSQGSCDCNCSPWALRIQRLEGSRPGGRLCTLNGGAGAEV